MKNKLALLLICAICVLCGKTQAQFTNVLQITLTNSPGIQKLTDEYNRQWTNTILRIDSAVTGTNSVIATNAIPGTNSVVIVTNLVPVITLTTNWNTAISAQDYLQREAIRWQASYDAQYDAWLKSEGLRRFDQMSPADKAEILARLGLRVQ